MSTKDEIFQHICNLAKKDANVIALFLSGSRGKHFENQYSDYDIRIIFSNNINFEKAIQQYKRFIQKQVIEIQFFTLEQLCHYAEFNDENTWDRYSFTHVKALIDKTDEIQDLIDSKGKLPEHFRKDYIAKQLDSFINACLRSLKCYRIGDKLGTNLEAMGSISSFTAIIFALEGRHAPFSSYLSRELKCYPLQLLPLHSEALLHLISDSVAGSITSLQKLMRIIEPFCIAEELGYVFEEWEEDYPYFLEYKDKSAV